MLQEAVTLGKTTADFPRTLGLKDIPSANRKLRAVCYSAIWKFNWLLFCGPMQLKFSISF